MNESVNFLDWVFLALLILLIPAILTFVWWTTKTKPEDCEHCKPKQDSDPADDCSWIEEEMRKRARRGKSFGCPWKY